MSHLNINGVDKPLDHIYVNTGSVVKEAWEARDKNDHLLWGRTDTFTGTSSISVRGYGLPVKSWEIDGNSQQSGTPAPDNPIDPEFVGERTGNLFNKDSSLIQAGARFDQYGNIEANSSYSIWTIGVGNLEAGHDYAISLEHTTQSTSTCRVCGYNNGQYVETITAALLYNMPLSFTMSGNWDEIRFSIRDNAPNVMVNLGSTPPPYEPYGWKLSLTSAGQTIPVYLGEVPTVRRVKKYEFTGQETISLRADFENATAYTYTHDAFETVPYGTAPVICSHFPFLASFGEQSDHIYQTAPNFYITSTQYRTVADFKSYLAAQYAARTPVTVWCVLAEPETAIVNEPLAKIGDYADTLTSEQAGVILPTNDGNTTISVDTSLAPSKFEIKVHAKPIHKPIHYGFKIDKSVSDPSNAVIYTHDAVTMTPAGMDFTNGVFDYGSWENVWFIKNARPVMLNFDGTEAYDLDPNDYSKKLDGTPSDITDSTKNMNAMIAFPTVWIKRTDDGSYNYIEISDQQIDSDFHAYAHEDANGVVKPYIYLPIYKGSIVDGKLRSISGVKPQSGTTAQQEVDAASALGTGWQIWDYTSKEMLCDLLTLISKSLDTQGKFGQGHSTGGSSASDFLNCGTLNEKGKFFGYSATTSQVKCFGMEALWAERWDRELGLILDAGIYKIKEHPAYNLTGEGYTAISTSVAKCPTSNNYIKTEVSTQFGSLPTVVGDTQSTYYCDYFYQNQSGVCVAVRGGRCNNGAFAGLRYVGVNRAASNSHWSVGASPVYKPI